MTTETIRTDTAPKPIGAYPHALHYALKANSSLALVGLLRTLGSLERVRASSKEELAKIVGTACANRLIAYFAEHPVSPLVQLTVPTEQEV